METKFLNTCVCVRTISAGVFVGTLLSLEDNQALLGKARRLWYWDGAASLSQLVTDGVSRPQNCKFPCPVEEVLLFGVIEILPLTEKAKQSIEEVPVWSA